MPPTPAREQRIIDSVIVDTCNADERATSWYYYLHDQLTHPFIARCEARRWPLPLRVGGEAEAIGLRNERDCMRELFVSRLAISKPAPAHFQELSLMNCPNEHNVRHDLDPKYSPLAGTLSRRAGTHPSATDSAACRGIYGNGRRAG